MNNPSEHIESERVWSYVQLAGDLEQDEHRHLSGCEQCLEVFRLCLLCQDVVEVKAGALAHCKQSA